MIQIKRLCSLEGEKCDIIIYYLSPVHQITWFGNFIIQRTNIFIIKFGLTPRLQSCCKHHFWDLINNCAFLNSLFVLPGFLKLPLILVDLLFSKALSSHKKAFLSLLLKFCNNFKSRRESEVCVCVSVCVRTRMCFQQRGPWRESNTEKGIYALSLLS